MPIFTHQLCKGRDSTLVPVKERLKVSFILEPELERVTVDFVFAGLVFVHLQVRSVFSPFSFVPD